MALSPDAITQALVLKSLDGSSLQFDRLIPNQKAASDTPWFRAESISTEADARGIHAVLWLKGKRLCLYRGDAIFPLGPDRFCIVPEEVVVYLMPAFYRMLHAEGHEPAWVTGQEPAPPINLPVTE